MDIAQRMVAGEGEDCPSSLLKDTSSQGGAIDSLASDDPRRSVGYLSTDETRLPMQTGHAQHRAQHVIGISSRARTLLVELARTVNHRHPLAAIFAKRQFLSRRAQMPIRTLSRALSDLEAAGLITRQDQRRLADGPMKGTFDGVYLYLTPKAAELLGFVEPGVAHGSKAARSRSDGFVDDVVTSRLDGAEVALDDATEAFGQPQAKVAHGAYIGGLLPNLFQKRQPGQVPADLERLLALGFSKFLVFGLMREARERGKRLSEVVEACWHGLRKAAKPICYLKALLRSDIDFGYQVRQRKAERDATRDAAAERDAAAVLVRQVAGQQFVDAKATQLLVVDPDGQGAAVTSADEGVSRRMSSTWGIGFRRERMAGLWRPATDADLEAFAQVRRAQVRAVTPREPVERILTATVAEHLASLRATLRGVSFAS